MSGTSEKPPNYDEVSLLLISMQPRLRGFVRSLIPNRADAEEVSQEVNLSVLQHAQDFELGTNFPAWSLKIARICVLKWRSRQARSKLIFDEAVLERIASHTLEREVPGNLRLESLEECLKKLPATDRQLVTEFYGKGGETPRSVAERLGRTPNSLYVSIHRIRVRLFDCIHRLTSSELPPESRQ